MSNIFRTGWCQENIRWNRLNRTKFYWRLVKNQDRVKPSTMPILYRLLMRSADVHKLRMPSLKGRNRTNGRLGVPYHVHLHQLPSNGSWSQINILSRETINYIYILAALLRDSESEFMCHSVSASSISMWTTSTKWSVCAVDMYQNFYMAFLY